MYIIPNTTFQIRWSDFVASTIDLFYSIDGGSNWIEIGNVPNNNGPLAGQGYYDWSVPVNLPYGDVIIRIQDHDSPDIYVDTPIFVVSEEKYIGQIWRLEWSDLVSDTVSIEYQINGTGNWIGINSTAPNHNGDLYNQGYYLWTIDSNICDSLRIRITDIDNNVSVYSPYVSILDTPDIYLYTESIVNSSIVNDINVLPTLIIGIDNISSINIINNIDVSLNDNVVLLMESISNLSGINNIDLTTEPDINIETDSIVNQHTISDIILINGVNPFSIERNENTISILLQSSPENNKQYTFNISSGITGELLSNEYVLDNNFSFWFTTTFCPLFTSLTQVKLQTGPIADYFIDDTIYRMIHKNSIDAMDLFNLSNSSSLSYDYFGCTWHNVPYILRKYVECKTAYDILALYQSLIQNGLNGGRQLKTLGDMTISYKDGAGATNNANDPNRKQQLYECWTETLRSIKTVKAAVKGIYDFSKQYPHPVIDTGHNRISKPIYINNTPGTRFVRSI